MLKFVFAFVFLISQGKILLKKWTDFIKLLYTGSASSDTENNATVAHDDDVIIVSERNEVRTLPKFGPEFRITFELLFVCFADLDQVNSSVEQSNILFFNDSSTSFYLSLDLLFKEKTLKLDFNDIEKKSPPGVFDTKIWYKYEIVQEQRDDGKVKNYCMNLFD